MKSVFAEHYDVTGKLTFDLLVIKCHHFVIIAEALRASGKFSKSDLSHFISCDYEFNE